MNDLRSSVTVDDCTVYTLEYTVMRPVRTAYIPRGTVHGLNTTLPELDGAAHRLLSTVPRLKYADN